MPLWSQPLWVEALTISRGGISSPAEPRVAKAGFSSTDWTIHSSAKSCYLAGDLLLPAGPGVNVRLLLMSLHALVP